MEKNNNQQYIDAWVQDAFKESGEGTGLSQDQLANLSQIHRSAEASGIFAQITGKKIDSKAGLLDLFEAVKNGEVNIDEALDDPRLSQYKSRKGPYHMS